MFENALMESSGRVPSRPRWLSLAVFVLNGSILALLILWPLLQPAALPRQDIATLVVVPRARVCGGSARNPGGGVRRMDDQCPVRLVGAQGTRRDGS
jgi:hypothetical protein